MVTQLQNQDPMSPASDSELLSQMSNIGSLESSTDLQTTMKSVTLQTQVGSASALIGKTVTGISTANKSATGVVDSVSVSGTDVDLNLDTGDVVSVSNLSSISGAATAASGTTSGTDRTDRPAGRRPARAAAADANPPPYPNGTRTCHSAQHSTRGCRA